jgi:bifunctional non-homologous end joining protein LigD
VTLLAEPGPKRPPRGIRATAKAEAKLKKFIKPMLAKLHDEPFSSADWVYEIKWDGYRAVAEVNGKDVKLYSRNGLSFADSYPIVYEELKKIKKKLVLDGEIVALDESGVSKFQLLQQYGQNQDVPICYYVFDCLHVNGRSIEDKPLTERKKILKELLPENDVIKYSDHIAEKGKEFFAILKKKGLEGMIAKRADSTYHEDTRTSDWLKVKNVFIEEAVIVGYTQPQGGRKYFGALVLALYKKGRLTYIGHTGTGFTEKTLKEVYGAMQPLKTDKSPFDTRIPGIKASVTWIKPKLVCNLKFSEITGSGQRRHPVFLGLRMDKDAKDVGEEVKG